MTNPTPDCRVGDVLRVPFDDGTYAFARVVSVQDGWDLVQLYRATARTPELTDEIIDSGLVQPPLSFGLDDVREGRLPIVHSEPDFVPEGLDKLRFYMGMPGNYRSIRVGEYRPGPKISDEEATLLPKMEISSFAGMLSRARTVLDAARSAH